MLLQAMKLTLGKNLTEEIEIELVTNIANSNYRAVQEKYTDASRGRLFDIVKKHKTLYSELTKNKTRVGAATQKIPAVIRTIIDPTNPSTVIKEIPQSNTEPSNNDNFRDTTPMAQLAAHKMISDHLRAILTEKKQRPFEDPDPRIEPGEPNPEEMIIISGATQKSYEGMLLTKPCIYEYSQLIEHGSILSDPQNRIWGVIGWLDGRERGNGCLNLVVVYKEFLNIMLDAWMTNGITDQPIRFKRLGNNYYSGTPAFDKPNEQYGEEMTRADGRIIGYYLIPSCKVFPRHYLITRCPAG